MSDDHLFSLHRKHFHIVIVLTWVYCHLIHTFVAWTTNSLCLCYQKPFSCQCKLQMYFVCLLSFFLLWSSKYTGGQYNFGQSYNHFAHQPVLNSLRANLIVACLKCHNISYRGQKSRLYPCSSQKSMHHYYCPLGLV